MHAGDAKNTDHAEVLWNCGSGLKERVDEYLELYGAKDRSEEDPQTKDQSESLEAKGIAEAVKVLRLLRSTFLGVARTMEGTLTNHQNFGKYSANQWKDFVTNIGETLHDYFHRDDQNCPRFRRPNLDTTIEGAQRASDDSEYSSDEDDKTEYKGKWNLDPAYERVESSLDKLPYLRPKDEDVMIFDSVSLKVGDKVHARLNNRLAQGTLKATKNMTAVFLTYDDLPSCFDEFQPRTLVQGRTDTSRHAIQSALRPSLDAAEGVLPVVRCAPSDTTKVSSHI
jgi:hypothetical protein